jgi:hypothetical protein
MNVLTGARLALGKLTGGRQCKALLAVEKARREDME